MALHLNRSARLLCGVLVAPAAVLGVTAVPAAAVSDFNPTSDCTIDTTALTVVCDDGFTATGQAVHGVAEFTFGQVIIGHTVRAVGSRPLRIRGTLISVNGTLDASGADATAGSSAPTPGGPGGGAGGAPGLPGTAGFNAPGGGGQPASNATSGGGGGGYVGEGADGQSVDGGTGGAGGARNAGDGKFRAGSGGAGGTGVSGGGGGGSVMLDSTGEVDVDGTIDVSGGNGAAGTQPGGASGGGSGGLLWARAGTAFFFYGFQRDSDGKGGPDASGGSGGSGVCCGYGGGGGGGEVVFAFPHQQYEDGDESLYLNASGGGPGIRTGTSAASDDGHGGSGVWQRVSTSNMFQKTEQTPTDDPYVTYGNTDAGTHYLLSALLGPMWDFGLPDETVSVYRKDDTGYRLLGTTVTASSESPSTGNLSFDVAPNGNTTYQLRWPGEDFQPAATRDITVHVRYSVEVHTNHYSIRHGVPITVYGRVGPWAQGTTVWLKRYAFGKWVNLTSAVIKYQNLPNGDNDLSYKFSRAFSRGTVRLEVVKPAGAPVTGARPYEKGTSRILTIKVS